MVPLLYVVAAVFVLWGIFTIGDRMIRARMLSRLRSNSCPKYDSAIGTSSLRVSGRITETFGENPAPLPYGSETLVELRCHSCTKTSTVTLRGEDVSTAFGDDDMHRAVGLRV